MLSHTLVQRFKSWDLFRLGYLLLELRLTHIVYHADYASVVLFDCVKHIAVLLDRLLRQVVFVIKLALTSAIQQLEYAIPYQSYAVLCFLLLSNSSGGLFHV